ncbi:MAG: hypothetical protein IPK16_05150 [Anaerolineales bacterium]|nr:hypothetical protein [Anaerolineales bacterium]
MSQDRSLVRASDIGLWVYCNRAWWLAKVKGVPHRNQALLDYGVEVHAAHGTQVKRAATARKVGVNLLVIAALIVVLALLALVFGQ